MDKTTLTINSQIADLTKSMGVEEQFVDKTKTESTEVNDLFDQLKLKQKEEADRQAEEVRVAAEAKAKADADIPVWDRPWDPNAVPEKGSGIKSWEDYPAMKIGKDPKNVIPEKTVEADASKSGLQEVYSIPEDAHDHQLEVWNLLDKDGKNVGGISKFTNKLTGENYIGERYLDPSLRGTGIGSQLLDKFPGTEPTGKASTIAALKASDSYKADKAAEVIPQPEAKVEGQPQEPEPTVAKSIISKEVLQDVTNTMVAQFGMRKGDAKVFIKNLSGNNPELTTAEQLVTAAIKLKGQGGGVPMAMRGESEFIRKEGIRVMTPGGPGVIASKGAFGIFTVKLDGEKLSRRYKTKEITELISPETTSAFTDTDSARFVESRDKSEYPEFLTPYTAEELAAFSTRKLPGKDAGYSVKPDGDIVNIFNNTPHKGLGVVAIIDALRNGGKKLDCFDIFLTNYYRSLGFEEVSRSPWDDQYAPPNWDYEKNGRPNVVYLEFRGEANADNIRRSYEDHWNTKLDNDPITAEVFNRGNRGAPQEEVTRRDDAASRAIPSIAEDRVQGAVERQEVKVIQPIVDNFINDHMPALKGKYEVSQGIDDVTDGDVRNRINAEIDPTQVKAMYNPKTGKFHIISDHLNYPGEAIAAILHEGFHAGLPSIFPNDIAMNNFLKEVYDFYGKDKIDAALSGRGYEIDHNKPEGQLQAANEMLANLEKDSPTLWQQLIDRMVVFARHLGEKFGFDVKFDERDIRRALDSVQEALTKPDDSRAYTGDGPPLAMRIASLPNWAKDLVDKAQSRNFMDNPDLSEEGKRIVNQATKQVKQFDSGAAKWWELYLSRPFQNAVRRPAWRRPWMIFGVERPELRANFDNDNYRLQQQLFKTTDPGSLDKITSLTFAMDAYKVALPGLTKEQRAETLRLKHIPKETLMEGIMIKGKMHQFTEAEADAYINQTKAISHMFESKMRFIEENMMRDFRNSKWYGILLNAHGEVNDEATQRLGARDLPLIGKANARDMRIQVRDVFANLEQQIEGLTPEQQKNLLANYQDTYNMLETGIKGIQEVVGKQLGIEGAELSKTSQEVVQAYLRTRPYMKMISEARKRFQADPFYAPRIRGKGDWAMKVFKDVEDPETGETKTTEVYSRYHDGKPRDIAEVMKMIYTETDANGTTEYADNGKLREGYRVTNERKDRTAEWSYGGVNDLNTFTLVRNAINRIRETGADPEAIGKMKDLLIQYLGEEMQARGWGHGIQRQHPLIKGYDTADLKEVMQKYTSGLGGLMSKQNSAREYLDYMMSYKNGKVKDVTFEPREFEALAKYGQDMLRNPGKMDRVVSWYRGLSMNFFLGGLIRAPLMHAAAN
jgi:GNAT superfamily N-acetyltransferase